MTKNWHKLHIKQMEMHISLGTGEKKEKKLEDELWLYQTQKTEV